MIKKLSKISLVPAMFDISDSDGDRISYNCCTQSGASVGSLLSQSTLFNFQSLGVDSRSKLKLSLSQF